LINYNNIAKAYNLLLKNNFDSIITVTGFSFPIQRDRQDLEKNYHDAGQFVILKVDKFLKENNLWMKNVGTIILSNLEVQDIDNKIDWELAKFKYELLFKNITDGEIY